MSARHARPAIVLLALALLVPVTGTSARKHHRTAAPHAATHHAVPHRKTGKTSKPAGRHAHQPVEHHAVTPADATAVPGGGIKLFCPARKNPLLIRKATQGAGTTVTVVCR